MSIESPCAGCGKLLSVPSEYAGRQARCPACGQIYIVPSSDDKQPAPTPSSLPSNPFPSLASTTAGFTPPPPPPSVPLLPDPLLSVGGQSAGKKNEYWMLSTEGKQYGPVDRLNLDRWFNEGRVGPGYQVRQGELGTWQSAELFRPQTNPFAPSPQDFSSPSYRSPNAYSKPDHSVMVLTMGILSWFLFCPIFGIVAWMIGTTGLNDIAKGSADPTGKAMMQVGYYMGMIHVLLIGILCGGGLVLLLVFAAVGAVNH
jgi:hypothetical protein